MKRNLFWLMFSVAFIVFCVAHPSATQPWLDTICAAVNGGCAALAIVNITTPPPTQPDTKEKP
jgi:hypothetical protein